MVHVNGMGGYSYSFFNYWTWACVLGFEFQGFEILMLSAGLELGL